jgi:hypothetical protein
MKATHRVAFLGSSALALLGLVDLCAFSTSLFLSVADAKYLSGEWPSYWWFTIPLFLWIAALVVSPWFIWIAVHESYEGSARQLTRRFLLFSLLISVGQIAASIALIVAAALLGSNPF